MVKDKNNEAQVVQLQGEKSNIMRLGVMKFVLHEQRKNGSQLGDDEE